ncbi:MAG TPA: dihydrodipicolinate synthase family protein [Fimbriimonas sp.]
MSVFPASVTPFDASGEVDHPSVVRLISLFRSTGCRGVVLAGTNGEGPSLSAVEKRDLVRLATSVAENLEIILGISTSSLSEAVWLAQQAAKTGASAGLVMPPSYFHEASEEGLYRWFLALADAGPLPLILYNFPQRTRVPLGPDLVARLARHERIVGLKDSSGERANLEGYAHAIGHKRLYVGDETLLMEALEKGWTGTISGAANILSDWLVQIVEDRDEESRRTKYAYLRAGIEELRLGPQPTLNKSLLAEMGIIEGARMRLPLMDAEATRVASAKERLQPYVRFGEKRSEP